ncbi:Tim44/TimA family putative adaptor protein [Arenibaculum sp.]|uniref:Tim44/TimA family putative adaptor protein n=1 Tax=Arenibaculum sp. TaxID=2865862 RepID=UPI002E142D2E|nr:Tim44/TimA family putative adaptor protein [Arenibaculum sp.]
MGDGVQFIDILILAMIAAFLVYRLRSVLGRRHGEERQRPNPYAQQPGPRGREAPDNVVKMPEPRRVEARAPTPGEPIPLAAAIDTIRAADPNFDEKQFVQGARAAFEMIVAAFARGDTDTLRPLLSDDVYRNFAKAIAERAERGETLETRIETIQDADIVEATLDGRNAMVGVRFVSDQINVTRAADGSVVDGDPDRTLEVIDIWTFARDTRSRDPNWFLVETRVPS